jgi:hypothetical protein
MDAPPYTHPVLKQATVCQTYMRGNESTLVLDGEEYLGDTTILHDWQVHMLGLDGHDQKKLQELFDFYLAQGIERQGRGKAETPESLRNLQNPGEERK